MGGTGSKEEPEIKKELNLVNFLDVIATKYILTQNFEDLKNLTRKEYCNKLIILTTKAIKKFFKEKDIVYLAERVEDGIPYNRLTTENIIYLDTNAISPASGRFSKKEKEEFKREREEHIQKQLLKRYNMANKDYNRVAPAAGGGIKDYLRGLLDNDEKEKREKDYRRRSYRKYDIPPARTKTMLSELDVRNPAQKDRMCKGIAKFYIKIAHLFAAIAKTVNPRYVFKDSKGIERRYSIWNKKKIPKNAQPRFVEDSLCSRRINAMEPVQNEGRVSINLSKVCKLNKKMKTLTSENYPDYFTEYGKEKVFVRALGEEEGIPALEELYNDNYDYVKGKFTGRISGGKADQQYHKDLQEFYEAFTASPNNKEKISYSQWNRSGKKRFADVPLTAYHESNLCTGSEAKWRQSYKGSTGLFTEYANHIQTMMQNAQKNQKELLSILQDIFVFIEAGNIEKTKILTLNPKLTYDKLEELIDKTRKSIVKLYIDCQNNFLKGLNIFEGIVMERNIKNAVNQNEKLKQEGDKVIAAEPSHDLASNIKQAMVATVAD